MKKYLALCTALILFATALTGCGGKKTNDTPTPQDNSGGAQNNQEDNRTYELTVSGIGGSLNFIPVYIAQQEGWFEAAGLEIEDVLFTNGPVQMESLSADAWDIGCTGVGGVLSGVIGYDAILVGASNSDDGTQYVFARNDSDIVTAGTNNNPINSNIYGDADSWKGKRVLCNTGTVLQYLLIKTLQGFDLNVDDVEFVAMDAPTAYSAFLAGEGDLCVLTGSSGTFNLLADTDNFTAVSSGNWADTGLMCNFVANKNSYNDPEKYEAMKIFLSVYFDTLSWMKENEDQAVQYLVDFNDENGSSLEFEVARDYLVSDTYYTLEEAYDMVSQNAEGQEYSVMEGKLLDVLNFFIDYGNYVEGDDEKFLGHTNSDLLKDVLQRD